MKASVMYKINKKDIIGKIIIYCFLVFLSVFSLMPIIFMFLSSFKSSGDVFKTSLLSFIPTKITIKPYLDLATKVPIPLIKLLLNNVLISISSTILNVTVCVLAAYSIAARRVKGGLIFLIFFIVMMIIPEETITIPMYLLISKMNMTSSYQGIIFAISAEGLSILILYRFFREIPLELLESAQLDGASEWTQIFKIVLPLSLPALTTVTLIHFIGTWNSFIFPLILNSNQELFNLNVGMAFFNTNIDIKFEVLMALGSVITIPTLLLFIFTQRTFIKGVTSGAIKG